MVLQEDGVFMVSLPNGDVRAETPDGHGLWVGDTRYLSEFRVCIDGSEAVATAVRLDPGSVQLEAAAGGLHLRRERFLDSGMHERITITNRSASAASFDLELVFEADYVDMMVLRGFGEAPPHEPSGVDVAVRPEGNKRRVELGPKERFTLEVNVRGPQDFDAGLSNVRGSYRRWASECASFETDNRAVNELLDRSRDDLRMLLRRYPTGFYPTGGVPWYAVPFGRDALITALFALPFNPDIARGALRFLAEHQGRRVDPFNEEEPGKILHEVRTGELVERGVWPHLFYGTVDATPLYLWTLAETLDWSGDRDLFDELRPSAGAALEWCDRYGDRDGDGYLEYGRARGRNQGWKDSDDSLTHRDGSDPVRPAALCEVQAYLYRALLAMRMRDRAARLKRRFNADFWLAKENFVAQALDANQKPVEAVTSNPGHCLWAGILTPTKARAVAKRLLAPDLFSGWGVRTLSSDAINYDARNGANGGLWAHDSAIAAAGMRRANVIDGAELVARSVLEAGMAFPHRRIPEYWCGTERQFDPPDEHPASCSPQSWSAAAPFSLLATLLGLQADATNSRLRIAPAPTPLWSRLEVGGLHFAGHRLDFAVEGDQVKLGAIPRGVTVETT